MTTFRNINDLETAIKNTENLLSDLQKAAVNEIDTIRNEAESLSDLESKNASKDIPVPSWSFIYALFGCLLGFLSYCFIYLVFVVIRRKVNSARDAEGFTKTRSLGEIYYMNESTGLDKIFNSKFINSVRYRDIGAPDQQIEKSVTTLNAVSKNENVESVLLLDFTASKVAKSAIKSIANKLEEKGFKVNTFSADTDYNEEVFLQNGGVVFIVDNNSSISLLTKYLLLIANYKTKGLGNIFISQID